MQANDVIGIAIKKINSVVSGVASVVVDDTAKTITWTFTDGNTAVMTFDQPSDGVSVVGFTEIDATHFVWDYSDGTQSAQFEIPEQYIAISAESGNALVKKADGLYVSSSGVEISAATGNKIETKADGLYVGADANKVDVNQTTANAGKALVVGADGMVTVGDAGVKVSTKDNNLIETVTETGKEGIYVGHDTTKVDVETGKGLISNEMLAKITSNETHIGDVTTIAIASVTDLVSAVNVLYNSFMTSITYASKKLTITYRNGGTVDIDMSAIITDTNLTELNNVDDTGIQDKQVLAYDLASQKYKPFTIDTSSVLQDAKDYTDEEIAKINTSAAIACDEKPTYSAGTITYKQSGVEKTTTNTKTWFYYHDATTGKDYQTIFLDGVEFTLAVANDVDFNDYLKIANIVSTYTGSEVDKTKVPNIAALDALKAIIDSSLSGKVNTSDIIDTLVSEATDKPLSAKQGKELKDSIDGKVDIAQGISEAGKILAVNSEGNIITEEKSSDSWTGTKAEWEALDKTNIKQDQQINITDDYQDESLIDDTTADSDKTYSSNKIENLIVNTVGTLSDLETTVKTNTVSAINEINQNLVDKADKTMLSNRNLLDNPFFTVNQRGQSSYTSNGYTVDRWGYTKNSGTSGNVSVNDGYLILDDTNSFYQKMENFENLKGKTITLSADVEIINSSNNSRFGIVCDGYENSWLPNFISLGTDTSRKIYTTTITIPSSGITSIKPWIYLGNGMSVKLYSIKLELGSVSTLAMDTAPNYQEELIKCMTNTVDDGDTYANRVPNFAPNPNLLDNPWFTVNQRGQNSYSGNGIYTVDRWWSHGNTITVNSSNLTINATKGTFRQALDITPFLGKTITYSINVSNASNNESFIHVYASNNINPMTTNLLPRVNLTNGINSATFTVSSDVAEKYLIICIDAINDTNFVIHSVKLELGSVSTLAMDTAPNYQQELAKCQRYYQRIITNTAWNSPIGIGAAYSTTKCNTIIDLPVVMREIPTINVSSLNNIKLILGSYANGKTISSITAISIIGNKVCLEVTSENLVAENIYILAVPGASNAYIELSADL